MLTVAGDSVVAGAEVKAILVDAEVTTRLGLRSLKSLALPLVGRFRTDAKVMVEAKQLSIRDVAERFPPGKARWYPKRARSNGFSVVLEEVGVVDLIIIWKAQGHDWHLTALISTLKVGIQELIRAWDARWSLEVSHRTRKQNLALGNCQCLSYAAQLQHADLVIEAFSLMRHERAQTPGLTWKCAQQQAALNLKNALLTGVPQLAA